MVCAAYGWSWIWWFTGFSLDPELQGLRLSFFILGGFGPAVGGVITMRLQNGDRDSGSLKWTAFAIGAILTIAAFAIFRLDFLGVISQSHAASILAFPADSPAYVYAFMLLPVLVSAWVISSVQSRNQGLRSWLRGIVPDRRAWRWALPVLLFYPVLMVGSNLLADLLGMEYEQQPQYLLEPVSIWLPVMFLKMFTVALLTGGNEEYGWRGVLQPLMQRSFNPLIAGLIIGVIWELWHFPIVLEGIYGDGPVLALVANRMLSVVLFAVMLAAIYNRSGGSVFLCILFHACLNSQPAAFGGSMLALPLGIAIIVAMVIGLKLWRRDRAFVPEAGSS
jgi:membrane protease YdiL (CAAX protease family)